MHDTQEPFEYRKMHMRKFGRETKRGGRCEGKFGLFMYSKEHRSQYDCTAFANCDRIYTTPFRRTLHDVFAEYSIAKMNNPLF